MISELRQQAAEQEELEKKAAACDTMLAMLQNAIGWAEEYAGENSMSKADMADSFFGTSGEIIDAVKNGDYEAIA